MSLSGFINGQYASFADLRQERKMLKTFGTQFREVLQVGHNRVFQKFA